MKSFEYQEIDLDKNSWKSRFKESFKMLYQRPIFSFVPFLLLSYVILVELFLIDVSFSMKIVLCLALYVVPLVSFEFCSSNDHSKIPFNNSKYLLSPPIKLFYKMLTLFFMTLFVIVFSLSMLGDLLEYLFPILKGNPFADSSSVPMVPSEQVARSETVLMIFELALKLMGAIITSLILVIFYSILFYVYLVLHASKMYDISDSFKLLDLALDGLDKNHKVFVYIAAFSFVQSLSFLFYKDYKMITVVLWSVFSSLGVIFCYLITKEISGGGSKVEQKVSLLSGLFSGNQKLAQSQS